MHILTIKNTLDMKMGLLNKKQPVIGNYYYFGKCKKKFKCVKIGTDAAKEQSDFIDYKKGVHQFYNHDMYRNKWLAKKNNCY